MGTSIKVLVMGTSIKGLVMGTSIKGLVMGWLMGSVIMVARNYGSGERWQRRLDVMGVATKSDGVQRCFGHIGFSETNENHQNGGPNFLIDPHFFFLKKT